MRPVRLLLAAILAAGALWGYSSGIHEMMGHGGHCQRTEQAAPSE